MAAGPGRDVDDAAVLLLAHRGQHRAHAIEHAIEIDIDDLVPAVEVEILPATLRDIDAGAVDEEVDAAVFGDDGVGRLVDVRLAGDIEHDRLGLAALARYLRHHAVELGLAAPRTHDYPPLGAQMLRPRLADAAAAAGHPCHAFPVICHANCLRCFLKGVFANPAGGI